MSPATGETSALSAWESFYVIVGSSGGALIGLQFVVVTLMAERRERAQTGALAAFATPTVVHLAGALIVSALMSAPWSSLSSLTVPLAVFGLWGIGYCALVIRRAQRQVDYVPVWEDWLWYLVVPTMVYLSLAAAALLLRRAPETGLFTIGAAALSLLLLGIRNAWDSVTHLATTLARQPDPKAGGASGSKHHRRG